MKIIAIEKMLKDVDANKDRQLLMDEARTAWQLQQEGLIRELYFHIEERKAVLIMEARQRTGSERSPGQAAAGAGWIC